MQSSSGNRKYGRLSVHIFFSRLIYNRKTRVAIICVKKTTYGITFATLMIPSTLSAHEINVLIYASFRSYKFLCNIMQYLYNAFPLENRITFLEQTESHKARVISVGVPLETVCRYNMWRRLGMKGQQGRSPFEKEGNPFFVHRCVMPVEATYILRLKTLFNEVT